MAINKNQLLNKIDQLNPEQLKELHAFLDHLLKNRANDEQIPDLPMIDEIRSVQDQNAQFEPLKDQRHFS